MCMQVVLLVSLYVYKSTVYAFKAHSLVVLCSVCSISVDVTMVWYGSGAAAVHARPHSGASQ